jgi:hypothetical protein
MRRVAHLLILVSVIAVVRACGGLAIAEDRIAANTRWIADKTGVTALRERWRDSMAPRITSTRRNAWLRVQQATSSALERLESGATRVRDTVDSGVGSVRPASSSPASGNAASESSDSQAP